MSDDLSPKAQRILDARKAAAAELKALDGVERPISDFDVQRLANARLLVDALTLKMWDRDATVSPADLKNANDLVDLAIAGKRSLLKVDLTFTVPSDEKCSACGQPLPVTQSFTEFKAAAKSRLKAEATEASPEKGVAQTPCQNGRTGKRL
jgi:hypothetical protein